MQREYRCFHGERSDGWSFEVILGRNLHGMAHFQLDKHPMFSVPVSINEIAMFMAHREDLIQAWAEKVVTDHSLVHWEASVDQRKARYKRWVFALPRLLAGRTAGLQRPRELQPTNAGPRSTRGDVSIIKKRYLWLAVVLGALAGLFVGLVSAQEIGPSYPPTKAWSIADTGVEVIDTAGVCLYIYHDYNNGGAITSVPKTQLPKGAGCQ
jgi:hypothetical protein